MHLVKKISKKITLMVISALALSVIMALPTFADGSIEVSDSYFDIPVGGSQSFQINAYQAAGRCNIHADGNISVSEASVWVESGNPAYITISGNVWE